jgi:hypothetical protein
MRQDLGPNETIADLKAFLMEMWRERAIELNHPEPRDLSSSCKFGSLLVQAVLGGEIRGNAHHAHCRLPDGSIVDLSEDAEDVRSLVARGIDPHHHHRRFMRSRETRESLDSCAQRVSRWKARWKELHPTAGPPDAGMIQGFRDLREEVRHAEGLPGQCHVVTEIIQAEHGWTRMSGTYLTPCLTFPAGDGAHYWNLLPDGSILDPTADQLGEDADDVRVLLPEDPRHARYVAEWFEDWHPGAPDYDEADAIARGYRLRDASLWTGETDHDAYLRLVEAAEGDRWWHVAGSRKHVESYLRKCVTYRGRKEA